MVSYLMTGIAVLVVAVAIITRPVGSEPFAGTKDSEESRTNEVLSLDSEVITEESGVSVITSTPSITATPTATPTPAVVATPSTEPVATKSPLVDLNPESQWVFPSSTKSGGKYTVASSTSEVTSWYKNKFKELNFRTTSAIETRTNGSVLNKLVASSGSTTVSVEIKSSESGGSEYSLQIKSASDQI
jgi:hypothetical protein